jgi:hypothetical protein
MDDTYQSDPVQPREPPQPQDRLAWVVLSEIAKAMAMAMAQQHTHPFRDNHPGK